MPFPGPATQIDLSETSAIFTAAGKKPDGLSRSAACLSLELARTAYSMNLEPWRNAGWRDFSILADSDLLTGSALNGPAASPLDSLARNMMQTLTHMRVNMRDPVTQYLGFKRQLDENASACKAVVMAHPCGAYTLIGISFKGTGKRLFDWIPNFRFKPENGYHGGFSQLTRQFMEACGRIEFPDTARSMGLARLTLADILAYMRTPSSPFRLWVCGHSLGAALMQIFIDQMQKSGIPKENMSGFGLASPSVTEEYRQDACLLPIVHILNADDLIPRVGFKGHLGVCYLYVPDSLARAELYRSAWASPCFREILSCYRQAEDTDDALILAMAALDLIADQPSDTLRRVFSAADQLTAQQEWDRPEPDITIPGIGSLARQFREQYQTVTGQEEIPQEQLSAARARFGDLAARYGLTNWFMAAMRGITLPHRMYTADTAKGDAQTAYRYIVTGHTEELIRVDNPDSPGVLRHLAEKEEAAGRPRTLTFGRTAPHPVPARSYRRLSVPGRPTVSPPGITLPQTPNTPAPPRPAVRTDGRTPSVPELKLPETPENESKKE